jgi:hypothetical protein
MAGKRDAEGIALLSVYGDEESDDDDLEDAAASPPPLTTTIPGETEETPHAAAAAAATTGSIVDYAQDEIALSPDHEVNPLSFLSLLSLKFTGKEKARERQTDTHTDA